MAERAASASACWIASTTRVCSPAATPGTPPHVGRGVVGRGRAVSDGPGHPGAHLFHRQRSADGEQPANDPRETAGVLRQPLPVLGDPQPGMASKCGSDNRMREAGADAGEPDHSATAGARPGNGGQTVIPRHPVDGDSDGDGHRRPPTADRRRTAKPGGTASSPAARIRTAGRTQRGWRDGDHAVGVVVHQVEVAVPLTYLPFPVQLADQVVQSGVRRWPVQADQDVVA